MPNTSDSQLWNQLRTGHKSALKTIYDVEFPYLYNYGRKIFKDTTLVEDAIHDLFVDIWNKKKSLGETDSIRKYLAASLRRRIVADLKKRNKSKSVESFDDQDFSAELAIDELIISKEIGKEQALKLKLAFEKLSNRQREVLYLKFYQGLDYEQISEVLDIKYQSLRNIISGGIKKLRAEMLVVLWFAIFQSSLYIL